MPTTADRTAGFMPNHHVLTLRRDIGGPIDPGTPGATSHRPYARTNHLCRALATADRPDVLRPITIT